MVSLRWFRAFGLHAGVYGKIVASGVVGVAMAGGALVGLALGDPVLGGLVGALVGIALVILNVLISLAYVRRRFDPGRARADGERGLGVE